VSRLVRIALGGAAAALLSVPMTAPSHAWSCTGDVGQAACLVVGTTCRTFGEAGGNTELCSFG
jgi:hypothetical protein